MENSNSHSHSHPFVPFNDPSDNIPCNDQFLFHDENPSLGLPDLPSMTEPSLHSWPVPEPEISGVRDDTFIPNDPLSEQLILDMMTDEPSGDILGNGGGGESGPNGESVGQDNVNNCQNFPQSSGFGNPVRIPDWPVLPSLYICSCCQILREIIHANGKQVRKLEIHGQVGIFSHAILDKFDPDLPSGNHEYHMFDFCKESVASVKDFLVQYYEDRKREGYHIIQDPFSNFYQALCIGLKENDNLASDNVLQSSMVSGQQDAGNGHIALKQQEADRNEAGPSRSNLAAQRERTGKLKLKDFAEYFDLPINEVAKKMNVCPTVIKKKCREGGLSRWPYRRIKGIKRKIKQKTESLTTCAEEERPDTLVQIQMLEDELATIIGKLNN